jgi:hypothetical protein
VSSTPAGCEGGSPVLAQSCSNSSTVKDNNGKKDDDDDKNEEKKKDKTKPKITDLPSFLRKHRGDKVWWAATDKKKTANNGISYYRYSFGGKTYTKTKNPSLIVPANMTRGIHQLKVKAYDKAGNSASKTTTILVW